MENTIPATSTKTESQTRSNNPFAPERFPGITFRSPEPDWMDRSFIVPRSPQPHQTVGTAGGCFTCGGGIREAPKGPFRLSIPAAVTVLGSVEVHTLRYGSAWYLAELGGTLDAWAARHGYAMRIHDGNGFEVPQFSKVEMIRRFLAGSADWFLYVDSDCYLHPAAPSIFEAVDGPGLWALVDLQSTAVKWPGWLEGHSMEAMPDFRYRNTGVFMMDRSTAETLIETIRPPYRKGYLEQHQFNVWFQESGVEMRELPDRWNSFRSRTEAAWCFHLAGHRKDRRLNDLRAAGRLPDPVKRHRGPTPPDFGPGAVVWPWKSTAAEWDELRYSVQSVQRFWSEIDWPLVLVGDIRPDWWPGEFIRADAYEDALWIGTQCADRVLWMNDDIFMIGEQSPATLDQAREIGCMAQRLGETLVAQNTWRRGLGQVLMRLHHAGKATRNFSTHTPYLFERDKAAEVFEKFGNFYKIPFETAYHNWHGTPWSACTEKAKGPHDVAGKLWINPAFRQVTPEFRQWLDARFRSPHRFHH